jgi:antitoxin component of MazEF toxin-antitoxin module
MENKSWTVDLLEDLEDPNSLILPFPDDLLAEAGWKPGDVLNFEIRDDGSVIVTKK